MLQLPWHHCCTSVLGWWSLIKCHVQTKMINMNSHGHGMYLPVLILLFFSPCLTNVILVCLCLTCVLAFLTKPSLGLQVYNKGVMYNRQADSNLSQPVFRNTVKNVIKPSCRMFKRKWWLIKRTACQ